MSWSITINDLDTIEQLPDEVYDSACADHEEYRDDAEFAFMTAKGRELVSATISGGRTPSPYGGPETVVICVTGFTSHAEGHAVPPMTARSFNDSVLDNIYVGPDAEDDPDGFWESPV